MSFVNSEKFLYIPSGDYKIGLNHADIRKILSFIPLDKKIKTEYIKASSPQINVHPAPYYISKKLITVFEFRSFVESARYITESEKEGWGWVWENGWKKKSGVYWEKPFGNEADAEYLNNGSLYPVMQVSWNDAVAYTRWISEREGAAIRLPSEVEWEIFAAYTGIKSISEYKDNLRIEISDSVQFLKTLGEKLKNSEFHTGLLWEWTDDWYQGYSSDMQNRDFGNIYKVLRGGSLLSEDIQKTREFRFRRCPTARSPYYGFRIVLN